MNAIFRLGVVGLLTSVTAIVSAAQTSVGTQSDLASHVQKAQAFLRQNRPDLAIPELNAAVALDPENTELQGNLGVLLYFQNSFADAIPHLRVALEKQPTLSKIQGLLGIAELRTSDPGAARKDMEAAFPALPDNKFKTQVGLELVGLETQTGDLEAATEILAQLRKSDPENAEVIYAAYRTYSDLAGESMLSLSLVAPDSAQMHQVIAHEETKQGNSNAAAAQFRKAIAIDPNLPGIHFELAELLYSSPEDNIRKQAEEEYRKALLANPMDEKTLCRLGEIDTEKGNTSKAYDELTAAVKMQPGDSNAKLDLAKLLIQMKQPDKARALLEETVALEPTNAMAHYRLGTLYRQEGRAEDAKRELDLYTKYKEIKEKLRAVYKEMQVQPNQIRDDQPHEK